MHIYNIYIYICCINVIIYIYRERERELMYISYMCYCYLPCVPVSVTRPLSFYSESPRRRVGRQMSREALGIHQRGVQWEGGAVDGGCMI